MSILERMNEPRYAEFQDHLLRGGKLLRKASDSFRKGIISLESLDMDSSAVLSFPIDSLQIPKLSGNAIIHTSDDGLERMACHVWPSDGELFLEESTSESLTGSASDAIQSLVVRGERFGVETDGFGDYKVVDSDMGHLLALSQAYNTSIYSTSTLMRVCMPTGIQNTMVSEGQTSAANLVGMKDSFSLQANAPLSPEEPMCEFVSKQWLTDEANLAQHVLQVSGVDGRSLTHDEKRAVGFMLGMPTQFVYPPQVNHPVGADEQDWNDSPEEVFTIDLVYQHFDADQYAAGVTDNEGFVYQGADIAPAELMALAREYGISRASTSEPSEHTYFYNPAPATGSAAKEGVSSYYNLHISAAGGGETASEKVAAVAELIGASFQPKAAAKAGLSMR